MTTQISIVIGFTAAALESLQKLRPEGSVILVDEPDVIRKRNIEEEVAKYSVVKALMPYEYHQEHAADSFYALVKHEFVVSVVLIQEYATPFAARLAERFCLPGASYGASLLMRDKNRLRHVSRAYGIANPASRQVENLTDAQEFADMHEGSLILKPANRQGSVGTTIVHDKNLLAQAWEDSRQRNEGIFVPDRKIPEITLIEQFIRGQEYSVEALVTHGQIIFSNITKKFLFDGIKPIENAHLVPAPLPYKDWKILTRETQKVLEATGFQTGIVHCEWMLSEGKPWLIECAGRFAGDGIIDLIERAYNFDIVGAYHALMRGEVLFDLPVKAKQAAMVQFLGGRNGLVREVKLDQNILAQPGVAYVNFLVKAGDVTYAPTMSWQRLGGFCVEAPNPDAAEKLCQQILNSVQIIYAD